MNQEARILIVDDDEDTRRGLGILLGKKSYVVETAGSAHEALEKLKKKFFNVALLDIMLPDLEGTKLIGLFKAVHPEIAVIMITGNASLDNAMKSLNNGASNYIIKPLDIGELLMMIKKALEKQRQRTEMRIQVEKLRQKRKRQKKEKEDDALTEIPNREMLNDLLVSTIARTDRGPKRMAVMVLSLDQFKAINETISGNIGDKLMKLMAARLNCILGKHETVAHLERDKLLIILSRIPKKEDVTKVANKILKAARYSFVLDDLRLDVTASIGIAVYSKNSKDADTLMRNAFIALNQAKKQGGDCKVT
jgi:diguanylate cyclase (GGDEF)-like protein